MDINQVKETIYKLLELDKDASGPEWYSVLMEDGSWVLKLGPLHKIGGIHRDTLEGCTDQGNIELITYYRNNIPNLAKEILRLLDLIPEH